MKQENRLDQNAIAQMMKMWYQIYFSDNEEDDSTEYEVQCQYTIKDNRIHCSPPMWQENPSIYLFIILAELSFNSNYI